MLKRAESLELEGCKSGRIASALAIPTLLALILALGFVPQALAGPASSHAKQSPSQHVAASLTIGDFDGDQRPDLVTADAGQHIASRSVYRIAIELSSGTRSTLNLAAPEGGLQLTSRDVNGDDLLDVIVTTAWTSRPVAVLLNDGQGNFKELSPEQFPGVFPDSTSSFAATDNEIRDSDGAMIPRYESIASRRVALLNSLYLARLQIPDWFWFSRVSRNGSFLGRAPPASLLTV